MQPVLQTPDLGSSPLVKEQETTVLLVQLLSMEWHTSARSDTAGVGSIQLKLEVEVVGPAHAPSDCNAEEPAGRSSSPLLGGARAEKHLSAFGIETQGGSTRWQLWQRCSLSQCGVWLAICGISLLLAFTATSDPLWQLFTTYWQYVLLAGLLLGLVWLCILSRVHRLPVVANAPRQQLRMNVDSGKVRILALNICLLPAGVNFSGKWLCDGDDKKAERLAQLEKLLDDFDIVLLNELWGSPWSGHHARFTGAALAKGFNVVTDPIGNVSNTGNMILSRFPLRNASSIIFQNYAGWQSMVPNGALHATTQLPTGEPLHLFTTHLQCTTAPPEELLPPASPSATDAFNHKMLDLLEKGEHVSGGKCDNVRARQLVELKSFMDSMVPTREDKYLLGGDLNIEGGSPEYSEMTRLFGRQSLNAPDFQPTYNTDSFLTPPGWRDVEYSVCLDHVLSNLDVEQFSVLQDDISDHRGLSVLVICPQPSVGLLACGASPNSSDSMAELADTALPVSPCAALSRALLTEEETEVAEDATYTPVFDQRAERGTGGTAGPVRVKIEIE